MDEKSPQPAENLTRSLHYQIEDLLSIAVSYVTQLLRLLQHHIREKINQFLQAQTHQHNHTHSNTDFIK